MSLLSIWTVSVLIFHIDIPAGLTRFFIKFTIHYHKTQCAALRFIVLVGKLSWAWHMQRSNVHRGPPPLTTLLTMVRSKFTYWHTVHKHIYITLSNTNLKCFAVNVATILPLGIKTGLNIGVFFTVLYISSSNHTSMVVGLYLLPILWSTNLSNISICMTFLACK